MLPFRLPDKKRSKTSPSDPLRLSLGRVRGYPPTEDAIETPVPVGPARPRSEIPFPVQRFSRAKQSAEATYANRQEPITTGFSTSGFWLALVALGWRTGTKPAQRLRLRATRQDNQGYAERGARVASTHRVPYLKEFEDYAGGRFLALVRLRRPGHRI